MFWKRKYITSLSKSSIKYRIAWVQFIACYLLWYANQKSAYYRPLKTVINVLCISVCLWRECSHCSHKLLRLARYYNPTASNFIIRLRGLIWNKWRLLYCSISADTWIVIVFICDAGFKCQMNIAESILIIFLNFEKLHNTEGVRTGVKYFERERKTYPTKCSIVE